MTNRAAAVQTSVHEDNAQPDRPHAYTSPIRLEIAHGRALSPWRPQAYGAVEIRFLASVAQWLTLAIDNARLYEKVKNQSEEL